MHRTFASALALLGLAGCVTPQTTVTGWPRCAWTPVGEHTYVVRFPRLMVISMKVRRNESLVFVLGLVPSPIFCGRLSRLLVRLEAGSRRSRAGRRAFSS